MSNYETFLAVYLGSKYCPRMAAWNAMPAAQRLTKEQQGMAAWARGSTSTRT